MLRRWVGVMWVGIMLLGLLVGRADAIAAIAPSQLPSTEVRVHLSNTSDQLVFEPAHLTFEAGKRYKLILDNPSSLKHYFTAKDFAGAIWSQKVDAGNVEIKGAISELELRPGTTAEWVFIPMKPGTYKLRCPIPGHTEAGMVGELTIAS
ncbi:MAG TPA: plastocyanin/azurin family copper-binding protein [Coleofasciculaceae cyanobacterium]